MLDPLTRRDSRDSAATSSAPSTPTSARANGLPTAHSSSRTQRTIASMTGPSYEARTRQFTQELESGHRISMANLRGLAYNGIPDKNSMRAVVWKLLLGYLPPDLQQWDATLDKHREEYAGFCQDLIIDPRSFRAGRAAPLLQRSCRHQLNWWLVQQGDAAPVADRMQRLEVTHDDHPLSVSDNSQWKAYFQDGELLEQIDRDIMRTHPDMHFFSGDDAAATLHRDEMKRALFIFAKLNPGLKYVQGMNELYAPLYYLFRTDVKRHNHRHAEADAFYCFVELISEFRDHFCQQLDNSQVGVKATLSRFNALLKQHDLELWEHLELKTKVNPQFYAFRWITLLLTQEFSFPDALRLWDTLLSDPAGCLDCLLRVCVAMLLHVREQLLRGDFAHNLKLLQRYPSVDVNSILKRCAQLGPAA